MGVTDGWNPHARALFEGREMAIFGQNFWLDGRVLCLYRFLFYFI